jgi:hypothetical protein
LSARTFGISYSTANETAFKFPADSGASVAIGFAPREDDQQRETKWEEKRCPLGKMGSDAILACPSLGVFMQGIQNGWISRSGKSEFR